MIPEYIEKLYEEQQEKVARRELVDSLKQLPIYELKDLADGFITEKTAYMSDPVCGESWLDKYKGTPLFDQAVQIEQQIIQLEMQEQQRRESQRANRQQMEQQFGDCSDLWDQRDKLNLQKRMLDLQLAQAGNSEEAGEEGQEEVEEEVEEAPPVAAAPAVPGPTPQQPAETEAPPAPAGGAETKLSHVVRQYSYLAREMAREEETRQLEQIIKSAAGAGGRGRFAEGRGPGPGTGCDKPGRRRGQEGEVPRKYRFRKGEVGEEKAVKDKPKKKTSSVGGYFPKAASVLTESSREKIKSKNFAIPKGNGPGDTGKYPIHDEEHARNALTRVRQFGTPKEKAQVYAAVAKKYPGLAGRSSVEAVRKAEEKQKEGAGLGGRGRGAPGYGRGCSQPGRRRGQKGEVPRKLRRRLDDGEKTSSAAKLAQARARTRVGLAELQKEAIPRGGMIAKAVPEAGGILGKVRKVIWGAPTKAKATAAPAGMTRAAPAPPSAVQQWQAAAAKPKGPVPGQAAHGYAPGVAGPYSPNLPPAPQPSSWSRASPSQSLAPGRVKAPPVPTAAAVPAATAKAAPTQAMAGPTPPPSQIHAPSGAAAAPAAAAPGGAGADLSQWWAGLDPATRTKLKMTGAGAGLLGAGALGGMTVLSSARPEHLTAEEMRKVALWGTMMKGITGAARYLKGAKGAVDIARKSNVPGKALDVAKHQAGEGVRRAGRWAAKNPMAAGGIGLAGLGTAGLGGAAVG